MGSNGPNNFVFVIFIFIHVKQKGHFTYNQKLVLDNLELFFKLMINNSAQSVVMCQVWIICCPERNWVLTLKKWYPNKNTITVFKTLQSFQQNGRE